MIRYLFSGLLLLGAGLLNAQSNKLQTYNALSARVLAIDHNIPNEAFDGLSQTFALELGYRRQLGKYFGVAIPLKIGIIDVGQLENISIAGIEVLPQFYPLGTEGKISPYLHTGYGIVTEGFEDANHQIPLGLGFNFKLEANSWFGIQGEYRLSDQDLRDNVMVGLGYIYRLSSIDTDGDGIVNRNDRCPTLPGPAATGGCPDADQDGITDTEDRCPNDPGLATLAGCPDTDQDGIPDIDDACPDLAGPASLKGCPDTDGDGVPDPEDRCPQQPGLATLQGCPDADGDGVPDEIDRCPDQPGNLTTGCPDRDADGFADDEDECPDTPGTFKGCPDTDGDGLADNVDRCPNIPGPAASGGCPAVEQKVQERLEYAARAVQFESGSATLKESSYVILSEIAGIMRQYPSYHLSINGHTDNVGSDVRNLTLSQERAIACRKFLVATGIDEGRISSAGFGDSRPLQSNDTAEGRRLNRRVEFSLQPRE